MSVIQPNNRLIVLCHDTFISTTEFKRKLKETIETLQIPELKFDTLDWEVARLHSPLHDTYFCQKYGKKLLKMDIDTLENTFETTVCNHPDSKMLAVKKRLYYYFTITTKEDIQGKLLHQLINTTDTFSTYIKQAWFDHIVYAPITTEIPTQGLIQTRTRLVAPPPLACPNNWNMDMIGGTGLTGLLGDNVVVAVLDGGIRTSHACFGGRIWKDAIGRKGISLVADNSLSASTAHGTQVAGLAVGRYGVASKATIMNVKITNTLQAFASTIAQAIHICIENNVRIINISYTITQAIRNDLFYPGQDQIEYAAAHKGIIVFSAGNDNIDARLNVPPNAPEHCIIVGGFGCDGALWWQSATVGTNTGDAVTVTAPAGASTTAAHNSSSATSTFSGTSAAAPHVAGLIAIMLSRNPALTLAEIKDILRANTTGGAIGRVNAAQVISNLPPP